MKVRDIPWSQSGGAIRWVRSLVITLLAVLAVLLHHEISAASPATGSTATAHAIPHAASASAMPMPTGHVGHDMTKGSTDGAACPSMAMQHCSSASVDAIHLTPPAKSPIATDPTLGTTVATADVTQTTSRAPPDLSLLSQLRI